MALVIADRIKETSTSTGTGSIILNGSETGFKRFTDALSTGDTTYYTIVLSQGTEFEVGIGTFTAPNQLSRDTVLSSSNSGSLVDFSAGNKTVFIVQPASKAVTQDASGNIFNLDTDNLSEGSSNLYFTNERVDDRVANLLTAGANVTLTYDDAANTLTIAATEDDLSNNDTDDLAEGTTNLYYTNERVDDRVASLIQNGTGISWSYDDASGTLTPTISLAPFSTSDLSEGTNLYYTTARFDSAFSGKSTSDLTEGTNLYYTDARARAAISVSGNAISYNSTTGVITANFEESPTFTGDVIISGNLTVNGTTTTIDTTNLNVEDNNITLNYSTGDSSASANGAGITIQDAVDASTDASLTWNATNDVFEFSHGLDFGDNDKIRLGASQDLEIYHDGSNSYIKDVGTGTLDVSTNGSAIRLVQGNGNRLITAGYGTAGVKLYYGSDDAEKLATTSTGIDVTGDATLDNILSPDNTSLTLISGGNATNAGANYALFGGSHASLANVHRWRNGSTEIARFDSSGRLGIGTTSPSEKLHVEGDARVSRAQIGSSPVASSAYFANSSHFDGNSYALRQASDGTTILNAKSGFPVNIATNNSTKMSILHSGNVGIGTTSPNNKLEVIETSAGAETTPLQLRNSDTTAGTATNLRFVNSTVAASTGAGVAEITNIRTDSPAAGATALTFTTSSGTSLAEKVRIDGNGFVGIGTTSPANKLDVRISNSAEYSTTETSELNPVGTDALYLFNEETTSTNGKVSILMRDTGSGGGAAGRITLVNDRAGDGSFAFLLRDSAHTGEQQEKMRITSDGNLGIGTASPNGKLDVSTDQVTTNQFTSPHLRLRAADTTDNTGFTGVAYSSSVLDNYGWTVGALRPSTSGSNSDFVFNIHNNSASGSEKMRIDGGTGFVGIGTTAPSANLHIKGSGADILNESSSATAARYILKTANQEWRIGTHNAQSNNLWFYNVDNAAYRMSLSPAGNLGIGTTSPDTKLEISDSQPTLRLTDTAAGSLGTAIGSLEFYSEDTSGNYPAVGAAIKAITESSFGSGHGLALFTNADATSPTEKVRISEQGDVGVGTDSPEQLLHLASNSPIIRLEDTDGTDQYGQIKYNGTLLDIMSRNGASDGVIRFGGHAGGNFTEYARFSSSGRLGIGTSSPSVDLHVNSTQPRIRTQDSDGDNTYLTIEALASGVSTLTARDGTSHGELRFRTTTGTVTEDRMSIDSSGNVGIGTTSPDKLLVVEGTSAEIVINDTDTTDTPTLRFRESGSTSGIIQTDASNMIFKYGTTEAMRIDSSGRVLVNSTSSADTAAKLQVKGDTGTYARLSIIDGDSNTQRTFFEQSNGTTSITAQDGTNHGTFLVKTYNGTSTVERFRINSSGVGIGTTSIDEKLHVQGSVNNDDVAIKIENNYDDNLSTSRPAAALQFATASNNAHLRVFGAPADTAANHQIDLGSTAASSFITLSPAGSEAMRIDSSGNVGIGTTSPSEKLHVKTTGNTVAKYETSLTSDLAIELANSQGSMFFGLGGGEEFAVATDSDLNGSNNLFVIKQTGNVGIGTTSPAYPLDVNGTARIRGDIRITSTFPRIYLADSDNNSDFSIINANGNFGVYDDTNAAYRFTIDSSGRVLVNSTSSADSAAKLQVKGDTGTYARLSIIDGDSNTQRTFLEQSNGTTSITSQDGTNHGTFLVKTYNGTSTVERFRVTSSGNVGIGTSSPSTKLDVVGGTIRSTGDVGVAVDTGTNAYMVIDRSASNRRGALVFSTAATDVTASPPANATLDWALGVTDSDEVSGDKFYIHTDTNASNARFVIDGSNGYVGIGTTSPAKKLHVYDASGVQLRVESSSSTADFYKSVNDLVIANNAASNIKIWNNSAERARIDSSGNFLVGKTAANSATTGVEAHNDGLLTATRASNPTAIFNRTTSDGQLVQFRKDNTTVGSISVTASATTYNTSSDARLKNITGEARGLEVINELNPVAYDWKADGKSDEGLIAQEVKELVPNAVSETEDGYYQMDYSKLVTPLIKAVQELTAKVESLEAQLANK